MIGFIQISFRRVEVPHSWAVAFCPSCGQLEAAKVFDQRGKLSIFFIPIDTGSSGLVPRCDFCGVLVAPQTSPIPLPSWRPKDGFTALRECFELPPDAGVHRERSPARMESLLHSIERSSSAGATDLKPGMISGLCAGAVLGAAAGLSMHWFGQTGGASNVYVYAVVAALIGGVAGVFIGGVLQAIFGRKGAARTVIHRAVIDYGVDPQDLIREAEGFPRRVRKAVDELCREAVDQ